MQVVQLELDFSSRLERVQSSRSIPSAEAWQELCLAVDEMERLPPDVRLDIAADAIAKMAQLLHHKAVKHLNVATHNADEMVFEEDFFDQHLAEPPSIDLNRYLKLDERYVRSSKKSHRNAISVAIEVSKESMLESIEPELEPLPVLELEHDEDIGGWSEAIRGWMMANNCRSGSISEIVDATQLSASKAWLAGLLNVNEFELKQENEEDFYSYDGLNLKTETVVQCEVA
jgi:hypothetical protein